MPLAEAKTPVDSVSTRIALSAQIESVCKPLNMPTCIHRNRDAHDRAAVVLPITNS